MKKFITAILAVLYIGSSVGASVHMHYCMGKVAEWSIRQIDSKTCGTCGMEKAESTDNGCCKDEHKFFKDDSAQKITESNMQMLQQLSITMPSSYMVLPIVDFPSVTEENPFSHAPPRTGGVAVYIRNCIFLI